MNLLLYVLLVFVQPDVHYKPKDEFEIKIDYKFRQRPSESHSYTPSGESIHAKGVLPYLLLNLKVLKVGQGEIRYRIFSNLKDNIVTKRLEEGSAYVIDAGFTADMKDRVSAFEYTIVFLSEDKKPLTRIFITVAEDGSFYVNGDKRGKF